MEETSDTHNHGNEFQLLLTKLEKENSKGYLLSNSRKGKKLQGRKR
jgi:hypothetical protein